ncbi:MAG: HD domain-containing protein [Anaerolineaceae bacterium]|nr:HD domain-containing protein [Anaerolineaceae bacterium]
MTTISFKDRLAKFNAFWEELETGEELSQVSDKALRKVVRFLPETLACPDITSTRIVYKDKTYSHGKISKVTREIVEPIKTFQHQIGQVEFHYAENGTKVSQTGLDDDGLILKLVTERLGVLSVFIEKDTEIEKLKDEALNAYDRTIEAWAAAFETQQKEASGHTERVVNLAMELAREMGFPEEELVHIRRGALLHDIGKISIPDEIISKHGKLTEEEFDVVRRHPLFAKKWLSQLELLKPALQIPYYHHERWDGSGYPLGLKGEDIPLAARMFSVIDVWDALTSDRPYRRALSKEEALNLIISQSGSHFDPKVVEHFVKVLSNENLINAPHQLRIQAFGGEKVWLQNIMITTGDWQVHAAKEMFFVFLAHPGGLTKEQVGLYMWPDASTEELDIKFKNTLYRLRSAVGKQVILLAEGMYRFNPMQEYAYDVEIFLTSIQRANEVEEPRQKIKHLSHAIQQYGGDYLPEVDDYWAIPDREKFRQMYIDALYAIANLYFEKEVYKSALRYCHQALTEDNANEEVHRLAMKIHAVTGNKAEIIRQYEACRQELEEKFDVEPSEQTQLLFDTLLNA